jgi:glycerophosphoryl diester phosphodiesterase
VFNLPRFHQQLPDVCLGLITPPKTARRWVWRLIKYDALHPHFSDVDRDLVTSLHKRNREINVWTVNNPNEIHRLANLGVDSIITNDPDLTREVLESEQ